MIFQGQLLHAVNGDGKIILSQKALDEAGLKPGMCIKIVIENGSITILPLLPGNDRL
jgi:hypothetical protein